MEEDDGKIEREIMLQEGGLGFGKVRCLQTLVRRGELCARHATRKVAFSLESESMTWWTAATG